MYQTLPLRGKPSFAEKRSSTHGRTLAAFDCETTGANLHHGDLPFMCCITFGDGEQLICEWPVDPETRIPQYDMHDLAYIVSLLMNPEFLWIGHNIKFDVRCIEKVVEYVLSIGSMSSPSSVAALNVLPTLDVLKSFDPIKFLETAHDTHPMSHAYDNRSSHKLKDLCVRFLDIREDDVVALKEQVLQCVKFAKQMGWKYACPLNRPLDNSPKDGWWVIDMWLPHAVFNYLDSTSEDDPLHLHSGYLELYQGLMDHVGNFNNLCALYCRRDTERTILLFHLLREELTKANLWEQYMMNQRLLCVTYDMEQYGTSFIMPTALSEGKRFNVFAKKFEQQAKDTVGNRFLNLQSPEEVALTLKNRFDVPMVDRVTKTGKQTVNKDEIEIIHAKYEEALESSTISLNRDPQPTDCVMVIHETEGKMVPLWYSREHVERLLTFTLAAMSRKKCLKAANQDIAGYIQKALCYGDTSSPQEDHYYLHGSINLVATDTTRIGMSDPNLTNISKGKNAFNEEIKSLDLSLRKLFGPVTGRKWWSFDYSQLQLVIAATVSGEQVLIDAIENGEDMHLFVHKELAAFLGWQFDPEDEAQRTIAKSTNFGFFFGASSKKIDAITHTHGVYPLLVDLYPNAHATLRKDIDDARTIGYVEASGYRLYVPEERPFAATVYKVQGWEGKIVKRALYAVWCGLRDTDCHPILLVHDEIVFDVPADEPYDTASYIKQVMEAAGVSEGIKCSVSLKEIITNYQEGKKVQL